MIYFGLLGVIAMLVLRWPAVAMGAVLSMYVLKQWAQTQSEWFMVHGTLTNFLTASILGLGLTIRFMRGDPMFRNYPRVGWVIIALFAWAGVSVLWSIDYSAAVANWKVAIPMLTTFVLLMPLTIVDSKDLKIGLVMTMLVGSFVLLLLVLTSDWAFRGVVLQRGAMIGSVVSDRGNPLAIATMGGWLCLLAVLLNFSGMGRLLQVARWGIVVLGLYITYLSGSRGQLFALLVALLAFLPLSRRIVNVKGFIATAVTIAVFAFLASYLFDAVVQGSERWSLDRMIENYQGGRIDTSTIVLTAWLESNPLRWVVGLGTSASYSPDLIGFYPHVVMAEVLAELGLVGFVLLWMVPILSFLAIKRLHPLVKDDRELRGLVAAIGAMFFFQVILSFKQGSMLGTWHAFAFAIILGRLALAIERERGAAGAFLPAYGLPPEYAQYHLPADGSGHRV